MNAIKAKLTIPALLLALLSPMVLAADAKHDDHGAAHAAPAQDAKPAAESKQADVAAAAEEPAKPAPKKKRAKKSKKIVAHNAQSPATADAHASASADDPHARAQADKPQAAKDAPPLAEPGKRLRLRKPIAGATADANAANAHGAHGDSHASPAADAPAPSAQDAHAVPAAQPAQSSAAAPAAAAHDQPSAPPPAAAAVDPHDLVSAPATAPSSKRVKLKKPLAAAPVADTHASPASTASPSHDTPPASRPAPAVAVAHDASHDAHAVPATAAKGTSSAAAPAGHADHADHADHAQPGHDAPVSTAAATAPVPAKSLPAHSGHSAMTVATPRAAEECDMPLKAEIAALFDRWNASLRTGDPRKVVANYAPNSILLPTVSNRARFTIAEKEDYFTHFLMKRPEGSIDDRLIEVDCNSATDAGLYTFRFADGTKVRARYSFSYKKTGNEWLITSHHSSAMPETVSTAHDAPVTHSAAAHASPAAAPATKLQPAQRDDNIPSTRGWVRFP